MSSLLLCKTKHIALNVVVRERALIPKTQILKVEQTNDMDNNNLKAFLECPICTMVPRKMQIFSCLNGHDICEHCFGSLGREVCPQGDCSYGVPGSVKVRARKLEMMIENAEFELNCRFSKAGCLVEGLRKDLDEHEGDCSFRTVPCPILNCEDKISLRMLDNHLSQHHKSGPVMKGQDGWNTVTLRLRSENLQRIQVDAASKPYWVVGYSVIDGGGNIYLNVSVKHKMLFSWLTQVCSPSVARGRLATIRLSHPTTKHYYHEMMCPVTSIDTPPSEVMESGNYLAVTLPCLLKTLGPAKQEDCQSMEVALKIETI